jgi:hypothetical protein
MNSLMGKSKFKNSIHQLFWIVILASVAITGGILLTSNPPKVVGMVVLFGVLYIISHVVRMIRIYILLIETKVNVKELLTTYYTTSWVNFVIPFKIGEIFRVIEYGRLSNSFKRGLAVVTVERFFDSSVLFALVIAYISFSQNPITSYVPLVLVLVAFLVFAILFFLEFPSTYRHLNRLLTSSSQTKKGPMLLGLLLNIRSLHEDIKMLMRGRTALVLFLSISIWLIEIMAVAALSKVINLSTLIESFFLLLNDSFSIPINNEILTDYKYYGLILLFAFAIISILLSVRSRFAFITQARVKKVDYNIRVDTKYEELDSAY